MISLSLATKPMRVIKLYIKKIVSNKDGLQVPIKRFCELSSLNMFITWVVCHWYTSVLQFYIRVTWSGRGRHIFCRFRGFCTKGMQAEDDKHMYHMHICCCKGLASTMWTRNSSLPSAIFPTKLERG